MAAADRALYRAKRDGRDRVVGLPGPAATPAVRAQPAGPGAEEGEESLSSFARRR
ncbi:hypothetical protein [Actinoplanes teichomyceticus]|uniref:GGDEF domain-containing protein n=1 Tax=Actinoplanes teichomyceticus TaxID=1867 RepID=A0A561VCT2_ACTTI|nr:hypothetical protein [Actinoplanes teichomyceticus]TWG09425.1 hypothetical protein FHX34_108140 [Actinoplanes teichomyceticus]GIF17101.1 hypothetical protein Ate01nite_71330 [Actinoplanes teichomyceticus]